MIYVDNAATSYPKPKEVLNELTKFYGSANRGASSISLQGSRIVYKCRQTLGEFFNFPLIENIIFTNNITTSLNIIIKSTIKPGWNILVSSMEHNSVIRPLNSLKNKVDFTYDIMPCDKFGKISLETIKSYIKPNTKMLILNHASNVNGTIQNIQEIGQFLKSKNIYFVLDAAQTAGSLPIDFEKNHLSALAFTGHKSLLGPQGIGGFLISRELNLEATTFLEGGTGSNSSDLTQPMNMPDKFECGTLNTSGIAALYKGLIYINNIGLDYLYEKDLDLINYLYDNLLNLENVVIHGFNKSYAKTPVISLTCCDFSNDELSTILDRKYNIITRSGLHCSPLAHNTIGTYPNGTIRISLGLFNSKKEIDYIIESLNKINSKR